MVRVSSKTSLIAAQIASLSTNTISSTVCVAIANVCSPTSRTATPSANSPTRSSTTRWPASRERFIASASTGSTPMMRTEGMTALTYAAMPASRPPPPTGMKMASRAPGRWRTISSPTVPCPAMTSGSSNGWMNVSPVRDASSEAKAYASA